MAETVVVTRHPGLVEYLLETGAITDATPVISRATPPDVKGKRVIGILPIHLAAMAESVTEYPVIKPRELWGRSLSRKELEGCIRPPVTYRVQIVNQGE